MLANLIAWAFTAGLFLLGTAACLRPAQTSVLYGVRQQTPDGWAWVRAAGLRDIGLGGMLVALLMLGQREAAAIVCIGTGFIAVTDLLNVWLTRGPRPVLPLLVHASGIVVGGVAGLLLLTS